MREKIIAAGKSCGRGGTAECNFALARYDPNGALDPTFGAGGVVLTEGNYADIADVALQSDGKIVAVGSWQPPALARGRHDVAVTHSHLYLLN